MAEYTVIDGLRWDDDGVCIGPDRAFEITDEKSFEWTMEQVQKLEFEVARRKQGEANAKVLTQQAEARLASFLYRFSGELENYAKNNLPNGVKTLGCQYGKVAFRATKPSWEVVDEQRACRWAKENYPKAVKETMKFMVSEFPCDPLLEMPDMFVLKPAGESVKITGEL
jgi:hypothetical protein